MGKKDKKRQQQAKMQAKAQVPSNVESFSDTQIKAIEEAIEKVPENLPEITPEMELEELPIEDSSHLEQLKQGSVTQYINYWEKKLRQVNAKERDLNKEREDFTKAKSDFEKEKIKLESDKKQIDSDRNDLNKRKQSLDEQQGAIDRGEYSRVIQNLLDDLSGSKQMIMNDTAKLVQDMAEKHGAFLKTLDDLAQKQIELESQIADLDAREATLRREKRKMEIENKNLRQRIKLEIEDEQGDAVEMLESKLEAAERTIRTLSNEKAKLVEFRNGINANFKGTDADTILEEYNSLKARCSSLQEELDEHHTEKEYDDEVEKVRILTEKVAELESKFSEERLNELRQSLQNSDAYILEINTYKARIDSAEAREQTLRRTVDDLRKTIELLREDQRAKEGAFEFAHKIDEDAEIQSRRPRFHAPDNLEEFALYIQRHMASGQKPFYYSLTTIQTFIAGLHMSPLSILWGISGTGKTSLPREFAKAMIASSEGYTGMDDAGNNKEPFRICAIQSGWRDNMDLIGFYNNFDKRYNETEFFRALYLAGQPKYKDVLFFIILDEMNLSRPEHYFADFLSLMEQPENARNITIKAPLQVMSLLKQIKDGMLQLPPNVRFIGTANHDETTLSFAPKTYDRSNVIELSPLPEAERSKIKSTNQSYTVGYTWLRTQFLEAEKENMASCEKFEKFIKDKKLVDKLAEVGIGIGLRFEDQAKRFISVYVASGSDTKKSLAEAADHLVTSRLLRTIPNRRLDFSKSQLQELRECYLDRFKTYFDRELPTHGLELLDSVIGFDE